MDKVPEDIRSFIDSQVREGFKSVHEIVENTTHYVSETLGRDNLRTKIRFIVAESLIAHRTEQDVWEFPTDCDRLDEAFTSLNRQGIVARQNFSCCNNCGFTEIWNEVEQEEKHQPIEGYIFYHLQCTERAIKTGQLLLAYGCIEEDEATLTRIANRIVAELHRVGLDAKWQGTASHPIVVDGIVWKKRQ
ncbi:MAG: hypothetical protein NW224_22920 [Leptolyngbyaceae cyanobacterium bins.302]|nr:hypothetical protein [Leptolyngbyaceae cyanobacterium bins.302]